MTKQKVEPSGSKDEERDDREPVMVWTVTARSVAPIDVVGTEDEAEKIRLKVEADGGKTAKKKMVREPDSGESARYQETGSFLLGEEDDDEEPEAGDGEETFSEAEEQLAAEVLTKLRASDKPLTVAELHPETNEEGKEGYVPAGQIDKVLKRMLVPRGLAQADGEAFVAVRPGALAQRRGEMLARYADCTIQDQEWADALNAYEEGFTVEQHADAAALAKAGLIEVADDSPAERGHDPGYVCTEERAQEILRRGAIALVIETMPECRDGDGPAVVVDGDQAKALGNAERLLRELDVKLEHMWKDLGVARQALAAKTGEVETLRTWFRTNGLAFPLDKPEAPKPPREEFTHTITPDAADKGRMYGIRLTLQARLAEVDATLAAAKSTHKTHSEMLNGRIKSLDDAVTGMFYDAPAFRRVDLQRGVAQIVHATDEAWVLEEKELRSEQIEAEKAKADEAAKPGPVVPVDGAPDGAMRIIPPGTTEGSEVAGTLAAAVDSPGFAEKLSEKIGQPVTIDKSGAVPVITVGDKADRPKPPPLTPPAIRAAIEKLVADLPDGEMVTLSDVDARLAGPVFGIQSGLDSFVKLIETVARTCHKAGTIHWEATDGLQKIGKARTKKPAPETAQTPEDKLLAKVRAAGSDGIPPADLATDEEKAAFKVLKERGAVVRNGKPGRGSRIIAKEHFSNGASEEASA